MGRKTHEVVTHDGKHHYAWLVWCPACDGPHSFDERWGFDGDHEAPTFSGSMLVYERPGQSRCHSLLTKGVWNYCGDSTHSLAGQSVPAPDWSSTRWATMRPDGVVSGG